MPPSRIPPLLQPYVRIPPKDSLTLLTSVIGATTNWLLIRYLCAAFETQDAGDNADVGVVFVSFMRDFTFWKTEARRAGLDLSKLGEQGRLNYVDGLSELFMPQEMEVGAGRDGAAGRGGLPMRGLQNPAVPARTNPGLISAGGLNAARRAPSPATSTSTATPPQLSPQPTQKSSTPPYITTLRSASLAHVTETLQSAITRLSSTCTRTLLLLDDPSILLSATTQPAHTLLSALTTLRASVHSMIISLPTDSPLIHLGPTPGSLELGHATLVTSLAHATGMVVGVRQLDTGTARDVSGVLSVVRGGAVDDVEGNKGEEGMEGMEVKEKEMLYFVGGDGSVKVFERGAGMEVG